ncbi:MAG: NADH-quinone oxidoreductase subunit NuoK [Candidatus Wukongarchaeota archaeon]|nr:NADH-quinone oxidoreductase subunit NuoK [Candidatus Wukongarchaeota archaeon]
MTNELEILFTGSIILFALGLYGLMTKKNAIKVIISLEIMFIAAELNFVAFAKYSDEEFATLGQTFAILTLIVSAAVISLVVAMTYNVYQKYGTLDTSELSLLKR